jgi:hypothetical protein
MSAKHSYRIDTRPFNMAALHPAVGGDRRWRGVRRASRARSARDESSTLWAPAAKDVFVVQGLRL